MYSMCCPSYFLFLSPWSFRLCGTILYYYYDFSFSCLDWVRFLSLKVPLYSIGPCWPPNYFCVMLSGLVLVKVWHLFRSLDRGMDRWLRCGRGSMDIGIEHLPSHRVPETIHAVCLVLVGMRPFYWQNNTGLDGANSNCLVIHYTHSKHPAPHISQYLRETPPTHCPCPDPPINDYQTLNRQ